MKIFLSWPEERSKKVAEFLKNWLPKIIQTCEPWISSENIEPGEAWFQSIDSNLEDTNFGIICLTPENKYNTWINYEAGALRKGLGASRVPILLIDLESNQFNSPLSGINHVLPTIDKMWTMIKMFNEKSQSPIKEDRIKSSFDAFWPEFLTFYNDLITKKIEEQKRNTDSMIDELLTRVKSISSQLEGVSFTNTQMPYITIFHLDEESGYYFTDPRISSISSIIKELTKFSMLVQINKITWFVISAFPRDSNLNEKLKEELKRNGLPENILKQYNGFTPFKPSEISKPV